MSPVLNCSLSSVIKRFHKFWEKPLLTLPCLSVRMEQLGSIWTDFHEIWELNIFRKSFGKVQGLLKSNNNNGYSKKRPTYICDSFSLHDS
jgi:bisphosphoglycerate-dependent phosphoglycerate mutase